MGVRLSMLALCVAASPAAAQAGAPEPLPPLALWVSASLGPGLTAVLLGIRARSEGTSGVTALVAVGPGYFAGLRRNEEVRHVIGISFASELAGNLRYVGIGISAFGGVNAQTGFMGAGITLELGKIH